MLYTLAPYQIETLADELKQDLSETYEHLKEPELLSEADLKYWERRRRVLLHQHDYAIGLRGALTQLNALQAERDTSQGIASIFAQAAE